MWRRRVIFGRWQPPEGIFGGAAVRLHRGAGPAHAKYMPSDLTAMAPYVVTVAMMVAVVLMERRKRRRAV